MKKILITSYNLDIGGIETSLINLLNNLNSKKYEITLILQEKKGIFLSNIKKNIKIEEYKISKSKNVLFRKFFNRIKLLKWIIKNKNKYDVSICYATYDIPSSRLAKYASKNNFIWIHGNYLHAFSVKKAKIFFNSVKMRKFNKIIFVNNESKNDLIKIFPSISKKSYVINNLINQNIIELAKEKIKEKRTHKIQLLFVGRLDEKAKKLTRMLNVIKKLKDYNYDVGLWIVGDGEDKDFYIKKINQLKIKDKVILVGKKSNPYPYFIKSNALLLTSDYEGFPVIFIEAIALKLPIISTIDISTDEINIKDYGFICDKNEKDIYEKIILLINNGFNSKEFSVKKYNDLIINKIENLIKWEVK